MNSKILLPALILSTGLNIYLAATAGKVGEHSHEGKPVEETVREFLLTRSDVLRQALANMQEGEQANRIEAIRSAVKANPSLAYDPSASVSEGAAEADVTLVEFFDYNCGYCKKAARDVEQAVADHGRSKVFYRMFPILGKDSEFAARFVLAAAEEGHGKQADLHRRLIHAEGRVTAELVLLEAAALGMDVERVAAAAGSAASVSRMDGLVAEAKAAGISGTPTFVVGEQVVLGLPPGLSLPELLNPSRAR